MGGSIQGRPGMGGLIQRKPMAYLYRGNAYLWMNNKFKKACSDWKVSKKMGNEDARDKVRRDC